MHLTVRAQHHNYCRNPEDVRHMVLIALFLASDSSTMLSSAPEQRKVHDLETCQQA